MDFKFWKKKEEIFLALDVGSSAVKVVIFKKDQSQKEFPGNKKIFVLANSCQYINNQKELGEGFELEATKKTIKKAIEECLLRALFSLEDKKTKKILQKQKKWKTLITFSPQKLKCVVLSQEINRKENYEKKITKKESKEIYHLLFENTKKEIFQNFYQKKGILPADIHWISLKVLERKIEGYPVLGIQGYKGKNLKFKVLAVFLLKKYLQEINKIAKDLGLEILKIVHPLEDFSWLEDEKKKNAVFLDIGGEISQIALLKEGKLLKIEEIEGGGEDFTEALSQDLGVDPVWARNLKEDYSKKETSAETTLKIKEILSRWKEKWSFLLKEKIKKLTRDEIFFEKVYFLGGGSLLPEIEETLEEEIIIKFTKENIFRKKIARDHICPKDINFVDGFINPKNAQFTPTLLICYNIFKNNLSDNK